VRRRVEKEEKCTQFVFRPILSRDWRRRRRRRRRRRGIK
jgi:hypothetical protein